MQNQIHPRHASADRASPSPYVETVGLQLRSWRPIKYSGATFTTFAADRLYITAAEVYMAAWWLYVVAKVKDLSCLLESLNNLAPRAAE